MNQLCDRDTFLRRLRQGRIRQKLIDKFLIQMFDELQSGKLTDQRWLEYAQKAHDIYNGEVQR